MSNEVKLIITTDAESAKKLLAEFGNEAQVMGEKSKKASESGRLGFFALGQAVEDSARSMGVAGQASRQMGNSIERLSASVLPAWGSAIGIAVLAIGALVQIVSRHREEMEKVREETLKSSNEAQQWIIDLEGQRGKTVELREAEYNLYLTRREQNQETLAEGIEIKKRNIQAVKDEIDIIEWQVDYERDQLRPAEIEKIRRKEKLIQLKERELAVDMATLGMYAKKPMNQAQFEGPEKTGGKDTGDDPQKSAEADLARRMKLNADKLAAESKYNQDLYNLQQQGATERAAIEQSNLNAALDAIQIKNQAIIDADIEERKLAEQKKKLYRETADNFISAAYMMAEVGGKNARKYFEFAKAGSIAQAVMNTYEGATKALAQGGMLGYVAAAGIIAYGLATVAKIQSQQFGGGGGAVGTYSANANTGIPENKVYSADYGTGWRPGEGQDRMGGTTINIYGDVYDEKAFDNRVNAVVQQNIEDGGDTRTAIQKYA